MSGNNRAVRPSGAPAEGAALAICPHCWHVNVHAARLCGRCGADMTTALQESGGLRLTAPIQSPVPVRAGGRLSALQRAIVLIAVALLGLVSLVGIFASQPTRPSTPAPAAAAP